MTKAPKETRVEKMLQASSNYLQTKAPKETSVEKMLQASSNYLQTKAPKETSVEKMTPKEKGLKPLQIKND